MKKINTNFKGLFIIKGKKFLDKRGFFRELLAEKIIKKKFSQGAPLTAKQMSR